nr:MAG TPA: hypothetical protein [Caudoviricetes sp.]
MQTAAAAYQITALQHFRQSFYQSSECAASFRLMV